MPLRLDAVVELTDEQLLRIAEQIRSSADPLLAGKGEQSLRLSVGRLELPESWRLVEERHGVTYGWPEGPDVYDPFRVYEGSTARGALRLAIGACERTRVRGEEREYFITGHVSDRGAFRPVAEFLATDDYEETGETIAIIKGKEGSARMFDPGDELPEAYADYKIETYRDRVDKPHSYAKLGIVADREDANTMLAHTFIQAVSRLRIFPKNPFQNDHGPDEAE